jgi:sulfur carrier protein
MKLTINGEEKSFEAKTLTVTALLKKANVDQPEMVSVEVNGIFLERDQFEIVWIKDGDQIEFLYFMGGGENV